MERIGYGGAILLAALLVSSAPAGAQNRAATLEAPRVEVVGSTPLPGLGVPKAQVPANIQVIDGRDVGPQRAGDITEFFEGNVGSVTLNAAQGNPYQPDVNFRGMTASPLLGLPQGLSVFYDGVRINEAFGDTVNWDLVPQSAIANITLIPGSNPVYGLNTLGGALAIRTKSGLQFPGTSLTGYGGSFGRRAYSVETGGNRDRLDYFVTANYADEDGWRDYSSSRLANVFAKVGYQDDRTDFDLSFTGASNALKGTQALPRSLLGNPKQAYTWPDTTNNTLAFLNATGSHFLTETRLVSGNLYYRQLDQNTLGSNVNDDCTAPCGGLGNSQAINDLSSLRQKGYGGTLQLSVLDDLMGFKNQLVTGASADLGHSRFGQFDQEADFDGARGTTSQLLSGVNQNTDAFARTRNIGLFVTNTLALDKRLSLTASGRYNHANVRLAGSSLDNNGNPRDLGGDNTFSRFNPALGVTFSPTSSYTNYLSYTEGMRTPTPVELTCANPNDPCRLPNAFLADPPLKPVVSRTYELGARGTSGPGLQWTAALFRTSLRDDIQFISTSGGLLNAGYFSNVGATRRQGLEMGLGGKFGSFSISSHYTWLRATYESDFTISSPNNSLADGNGDIQVVRGNRIPGIPTHNLKLRADYALSDAVSFGGNLIVAGSQFARGDENNADSSGKVPGYAVVNLDGRYQITKQLQVFARAVNIFDRQYETFGILGSNFFASGAFDPSTAAREQFRGPGMPRGIWIGLRYDIGRAAASTVDTDR